MHSIFDLVQLIFQNVWLYGGAFILVLSILVFVHEWGHYIVAVKCGVKIDTFSIGFGKELCGWTDKHGTRWKISLFPLGGYVKMFGDVDPASAGHTEGVEDEKTGEVRPFTDKEKKISFFYKPLWQRTAIVFAGPAINFIFAIFILTGLFITYGQPVKAPISSSIIAGKPADLAGFMPHDRILSIDGHKVRRFSDVRRAVMVALDTPLNFVVDRNGKELEITVKPEKVEMEDRFGFKHSYGFLGIISPGNALDIKRIVEIEGKAVEDSETRRQMLLERLGSRFTIKLDRGPEVDEIYIHPFKDINHAITDPENPDYGLLYVSESEGEDFIKHNVFTGFVESIKETYVISMSTLHALGQMITGTRSATELGGIIRIGAIAGDMAKSGLVALISFTALLSINLGLINLFPIPMLDGGHLLFYAAEAIKGDPLSEQFQEYAFRLGLAILVGIMLFANINDLVQIFL
jgi:regulator of sigma E protease